MNIVRRLLPWLLVVIIVSALALPKLLSSQDEHTGPGAPPAPQLVRTTSVQPQLLNETIRFNGTLLAEESVEVRSEITGFVRSIHFREDSPVEAGQLLVKIDDRELVRQLDTVQQRYNFAVVQEERQRRLLNEGGTTQAAYDEALNNLNIQRAELALLQTRLDRTEVRAPFSGVIGLRRVSPGTLVQPTTPIASLVKLDILRLDFAVPERYQTRVRTGMEVSVRVVGLDRTFTGTVVAREPSMDPSTRTLTLRANIDNSDGVLIPGGFASVELVLNSFEGALLIPAASILPSLTENAVFVVREGRVERRVVRTGMRTDDQVHVVDGLSPDDEVIVSGVQRVRPGQPVRAVRKDS